MQCAHRFASSGTSLKHSPHFFVVGSAGGAFLARATSKFIGLITKKNIAAETKTNETNVFKKWPMAKLEPLTVNAKLPKSGTFAIAAMSGVKISETNAATTVPNAAPITTPTAKSTTLPRNKKLLNSFNVFITQLYQTQKETLTTFVVSVYGERDTLPHLRPLRYTVELTRNLGSKLVTELEIDLVGHMQLHST